MKVAYDLKALGSYLDLVNVMTYDYHGFWDGKTGHHSPIRMVEGDKEGYNSVRSHVFAEPLGMDNFSSSFVGVCLGCDGSRRHTKIKAPSGHSALWPDLQAVHERQ